MTTGFIAPAGDLDVLFKARTSAKIADVGFLSNGGVDLSNRFEPRGSTTARANTNFKAGANDLASLFMDISAVTNPITLSNRTVSAHNTGSVGIAQYILSNIGDIRCNNGTNTIVDQGDWLNPKADYNLYSARMTILSGSSTSGTFGSYLNLATTRTWTLNGGSGGVDASWFCEIRLDSSGVVLGSCTLTVHAERDA